jgi:hypothetical protein
MLKKTLFFVCTEIKNCEYIKPNNGLIKLHTNAKYKTFVPYPTFAEPLLTMDCRVSMLRLSVQLCAIPATVQGHL